MTTLAKTIIALGLGTVCVGLGSTLNAAETVTFQTQAGSLDGTGGGNLLAAVNAVDRDVKAETTATDQQLQTIESSELQTWNQYVKLQADQQFSWNTKQAQGNPLSSYNLIDTGVYQPASAVLSAQAAQWPAIVSTAQAVENCTATTVVPLHGPPYVISNCLGNQQASANTNTGQNVNQILQQETGNRLALLASTQYSADESQAAQSSVGAILSAFVNNNSLISPMASIPVYVLADIEASRTAGMNGEPSLMATLETLVVTPLSASWEQGLANANALDVMRAQTALLAVNNLLQYRRLELQQQQLAMQVVIAAELAHSAR